MFADIIIDITHEKLDKVFQYRIPSHLEGMLKVGTEVVVPFGKGNKERTIYLNKACIHAVTEYLNVRPKDGIKTDRLNSRKALFLSERKERISKRTVQYIVDKELMAAGLDTKIFYS